jgi:Icc-related predicted phosphoesterase
MKLLITADLHFRISLVSLVDRTAPDFNLICIAGGLLDMFRSEPRMEQAHETTRLVRELADIVPVADCSGNHDNAGRLVSHDRGRRSTGGSSNLGRIRHHHHVLGRETKLSGWGVAVLI